MKKITIIFLLVTAIFGFNSCLRWNLEELPSFSDANITSINGVQYRYYSDDITPVNGDKVVKYEALSFSNTQIDEAKATCSFDVSIPSGFPEQKRNDVNLSELVVIVQISTAARCSPVGNSPAFGVPGDWTKANRYTITAADGTTKEWTVTINKLTK